MTDGEQTAHAAALAAHKDAIHASWLVWKAATDAATAALHEAEAAAEAAGPPTGYNRELNKAYDAYRAANIGALRAHREACSAADDELAAALDSAR